MCREVLDCSAFIFSLFIALWDIAYAVFLQLLACKEPPCDGVEAQYITPVSCAATHTRLLRPSTNFRPFLLGILHSSRVIDNGREDSFLLPQMFMPKEFHLRQLLT